MKKTSAFVVLPLVLAIASPLFANGTKEAADSAFKPSKDIEWFVSSSPGGGSDIYTRMISDIMTRGDLSGGQSFLVANKTDGGGEVVRLQVSRVAAGAQADHTLLTFNSGDLMPMVKNTANRLENFTPIALMAVDKQLLYIGEMSKYKSFAEIIAAVKGGAKVVIAGSKGDDVATYELLVKELGFTQSQIAYITNDATSGAITSILGGHVDLVISKPAAADQYVVAGKLTPVLALSKTRFTGNLAGAPRLSELGAYKDVEFPVWRGVVAPKSMSPAAVAYWSRALKEVSESAAWQSDYIGKFKLQPAYMTSSETAAFMAEFQATYLKSIGK
ncbi:MAG: tripartite tricarboxylate transporter substrate binding protein [Spirochaetes bacterium]|nr:tripartite tricarboxylate transporter substrate binding protein [Spirochaetota bacterium]MBU1079422.1 tripartite tricarboxylate transporter substrate binding protein [Spirochaetota bacterium]